MWDVAVIGAGLAGLTCARQLRAAGNQVCILDKSRGLGGRMATRRVTGLVRVDHGLRYWQPTSVALDDLTQELLQAKVLRPWPVTAYELRQRDELVTVEPGTTPGMVYAAPEGMSAIAKYLARDFTPEDTLLKEHRATSLTPYEGGWRIGCEGNKVVMAQRCAIAIPAPQLADLLSTCPPGSLQSEALSILKSVDYHPCITVLAGYGQQKDMGELDPNGWMVTDTIGTSTDWIGLDSSKRAPSSSETASAETTVVIHSKPDFARRYLDSGDLQPAASVLLRASARKYGDWLAQPEWFQIHRWHYAQVKTGYSETALILSEQPQVTLVSGGDWCSHQQQTLAGIDAAYLSGNAMAEALK
ncbi:MAG: FAD-dependent oxidoreductase [Cyanobacteria bacterium J06632_3]